MRVHHLNCISGCPLGGLLMDGFSLSLRGRLASHCLLLEDHDSLVLIDTGYGLRDVADPRGRLSPFFRMLLKPDLREEMTAVRQIERLGFRASDVRHIVLSHLDFDHAGGLDDFPAATVHMLGDERRAAEAPRTWLDRMRYRPQQWNHRETWRTYEAATDDSWMGFSCVREIPGLNGDVLLIPLVGHTLGHAGVAVRQGESWLLYAADAYFFHEEMNALAPRCTPGLSFYQTIMEKDREKRLENQARLRDLASQGSGITVFCAHDVTELERLSGRAQSDMASPVRLPQSLPTWTAKVAMALRSWLPGDTTGTEARAQMNDDSILHGRAVRRAKDGRVDLNSFDSFPASDAPSWSPTSSGGVPEAESS